MFKKSNKCNCPYCDTESELKDELIEILQTKYGVTVKKIEEIVVDSVRSILPAHSAYFKQNKKVRFIVDLEVEE